MSTESLIHHPVMLDECIDALNIIPNGIYLDGTFGRGGHASEILKRLNANGRLICLDKDPDAIAIGRELLGHDPRVSFHQVCFSQLATIAEQCGVKNQINGILLDLGICSGQLEDAARGFSFMREGPLDMRMDTTQGMRACEWLNEASESDIAWVLKIYGEEPFAKRIARKICEARQTAPITTTLALANIVAASIPAKKWQRQPAAKTFQAIRIHINQELQAIDAVLMGAEQMLAPLGRLAMISFHSLEDRKVKHYFRSQSRVILPPGIAIPQKDLITSLNWIIKRQCPSQAEIQRNSRARSATLRVAEKSAIFNLSKEV